MGFAGTKTVTRLLLFLLMQKECSSFVWNSQGVVYPSPWSGWLRTYLYSVILVKLDLLPAKTQNMTINLFVDGQSAISRILGGFFCSRLFEDRCQKNALSSVIRLYPLSPLVLSFSFFLSLLSLFFSFSLFLSLSRSLCCTYIRGGQCRRVRQSSQPSSAHEFALNDEACVKLSPCPKGQYHSKIHSKTCPHNNTTIISQNTETTTILTRAYV